MFRLGIGAVIGSLVMMFFGFQEWRLSSSASAEPEEMTLPALIKRGPQGNPHILLADFSATPNWVIQERRRGSSGWEKVWVPLVPLGEGDPGPEGQVKALLYSTHAGNADDVRKLVLKDKLPGMVINEIESLGYKERDLLQKSYPRADLYSCIIFEAERKPGGLAYVIMLVGGGIALFAIGFVIIARSFK